MWRRRRSPDQAELEAALQEQRTEAPDDLVESLSRRIGAERPSARRAWSRTAYAGAVSVFIVGTFASFGGLGYAASPARSTYDAVKQIVVKHKLTVSVHTSSAAAQYHPKPHAVAPARAAAKPAGAVAGVTAVKSGTLPFTGLSLLATFMVSLALIAVGVALRRRERRN